ncbi:hypothetical protein ACPA9J_20960 [Pseudomonas aeruginosa]
MRPRYRPAVPAAPRRPGEGAARGRLDGGEPEGLDVRLGEDPEPYAHLGSLEFAKKLLQDAKVSVSPGIGFGDYGDDHVRFALIENRDRLRQAVRGIKAMFRADGSLSPQRKVDSLAE